MTKATNPTFNNLKLAGRVREVALSQILEIIEDRSEANNVNRLQFLQRLAPNLLPRLNEHSGPDGGDIPIPLLHALHHNTGHQADSQPQKED